MIVRRNAINRKYASTRFEYYCSTYDRWFILNEIIKLPERDEEISRARISERLNCRWNRKKVKTSFKTVIDCVKKEKIEYVFNFDHSDNEFVNFMNKMPVGSLSSKVR